MLRKFINLIKLGNALKTKDSSLTIPSNPTENDLINAIGNMSSGAPTDPNLLAENIKSGVTISGVVGNFTSDADATTNDIIETHSAYVNGEYIDGGYRPVFNWDSVGGGATKTFTLGRQIYGYWIQIVASGVTYWYGYCSGASVNEWLLVSGNTSTGTVKVTAKNFSDSQITMTFGETYITIQNKTGYTGKVSLY
jgi:hypothetical protein